MNRTVRLLPVLAVPAVVIAGAIAVPAMASAAPSLPSKSPAQVLALMAKADDAHFSGTVQQTADLGLPQLPSGAGTGAGSADSAYGDVLELLGGSHTAKVWVDGAAKQRVQVTDQLAERDVIRNGRTVWTWDSAKNRATKATLPSKTAPAPAAGTSMSPISLAKQLVAKLTPSTKLSVDTAVRVAGRAAYQLVLDPTSTATLVDRVTLAVDSDTGVPLRIEVDARGQQAAAFSLGFSSIDFGTPDAGLFRFSAPNGAQVTTKDLSTRHPQSGSSSSHATVPAADRPKIVGSGWDSIAIIPAKASGKPGSGSASFGWGGSGSGSGSTSSDASALLGQLTTRVAGGRAVQTSLVSVLLADDGRVLVGAVPVSVLEAAAR